MPFNKWLKQKRNHFKSNQKKGTVLAVVNGKQQEESTSRVGRNYEKSSGEDISIFYLATDSPMETVIAILQSISENETKVS